MIFWYLAKNENFGSWKILAADLSASLNENPAREIGIERMRTQCFIFSRLEIAWMHGKRLNWEKTESYVWRNSLKSNGETICLIVQLRWT